MQSAGYILAALLILTGVVWILQGVNILPGSFMTGDLRWAIAGAVSALIGILLAITIHRRGR
jgi:hypothetical protein